MRLSGSLDTNAILRFLIGDIPKQRQAVSRLIDSSVDQLAVADIAVVETIFVLQRVYGVTREEIANMIRVFMGLKAVNCNRAMLDEALNFFVRFPAQSFEDCCLAVYAELNNAEPLYTFDKKLANQLSGAKLLVS